MKKLCYLLLVLSVACASSGKTSKKDSGYQEKGKKVRPVEADNLIYTVVDIDQIPEFPGGDDARIRYLQENIIYSKHAQMGAGHE
jgi:hypothetical protein